MNEQGRQEISAAPVPPRKTIMVVEDDPDFRRMLTSSLVLRTGYRVVTAVDGREITLLAQDEKPDLILMDMAMPYLNGVAATELLKADPLTHHIPVVAFSNYGSIPTWRKKALEAGVARCLDKSIRLQELEDVLDEVLREQEESQA
jgi:CheY-like chemotaxis protein